ncbi:SRPBCC family protein [Raineyella fluvialis]|uniref:SRPBCC family protein n=1 Tax=Raineyella fluvialis TaxID=2662261 RepID=A0A5Q2F896_9ACTN|nr:SRPBCC family protein [Raineyella fluvialis]QGF22671.1 SRPBCC family protein [Raineyella fluvialis]
MTDTSEMSRHVSLWIDQAPEVVYAYAADPRRLPEWAAGLAGASVEPEGEAWATDSAMGRVRIAFTPGNQLGVLDHVVTLPSGEQVYNPMRVLPGGADGRSGCEVVFTVRRREGMSEAQFEADADAVAADLATLKHRVEAV